MSLKNKHGITEYDHSALSQEKCSIGISFQLSDGTFLFAPYNFLSHARFQNNEITIHYAFGVVRIIGARLKEIYTLVKTNMLHGLHWTNNETFKLHEAQITDILFETVDNEIRK